MSVPILSMHGEIRDQGLRGEIIRNRITDNSGYQQGTTVARCYVREARKLVLKKAERR